jgi:hypothetical protein
MGLPKTKYSSPPTIGTNRQITIQAHLGRFLTSFFLALAAKTVTKTVNSNQAAKMKRSDLTMV